MSHSSDNEVVFDGGCNGLASDAFLRYIRRTAITERIQDDDRLIAQTAASSLGGEAVEWYEDQSEELQESWKLLRRAILVRWPIKSTGSSIPSTTNAPTPAAATIPTPAAAPPPSAQASTSTRAVAASIEPEDQGKKRPASHQAPPGIAGVGANGGLSLLARARAWGSTTDTYPGIMDEDSNAGDEDMYKYRGRALYNYTANPDNPNELSFKSGEILDIVDKKGKWWQAKKADGKTGVVPGYYVHVP